MIKIEDLYKSFGYNEILKGINLEVRQGEVTVIIGPSGSGKTTLLRCINLLELPTSGSISVGNATLSFDKTARVSQKDIISLRKHTGMVFQGFHLFPHMTALENVMEGQLTVLKRSKDLAAKKAVDLLTKVGLEDRVGSYPHQLSGGQQQRVAIARAMAMDPSVILFDEPTSALDPELVGEVQKVIKDLAHEGLTMVIVTHKMSLAKEIANKLVFIEGGHILEEGSPEELLNKTGDSRIKRYLSLIDD